MIDSLIALQIRHGPLTYEFAVERSFAEGTDREERQTFVDELIFEEIIEENTQVMPSRLWIDEDGDALLDYWDWVDEVDEKLDEAVKSLQSVKIGRA